MANLKQWLRLRKNAFSEKAAQFGLTPPRGVLMLGVQGAGKSLCAKAIAAAWQQPLFRLDCGTLYNSYVGQSERNLRKALRQIEAMSPAILWIDEIEKAHLAQAAEGYSGAEIEQAVLSALHEAFDEQIPLDTALLEKTLSASPPIAVTMAEKIQALYQWAQGRCVSAD